MLRNQAEAINDNLFGKEYFDSGKPMLGAFEYYSFEDTYLRFKILCQIVKKYFNPKRVLDVGCTKGFLVYTLREMEIEAFDVDINEYAISYAPVYVQPYLYKVDLNKDSLPFEDNYFDFVTFFGTIEYLYNHRHAIHEIERVLVRGGSLLLITIYKSVRGDAFRINVHNKTYWIKEFGNQWKISKVYYNFLRDYFRKLSAIIAPTSNRIKIGKLLYGKLRFPGDKILILLWDVLTTLSILDYGIVLFTLKEK